MNIKEEYNKTEIELKNLENSKFNTQISIMFNARNIGTSYSFRIIEEERLEKKLEDIEKRINILNRKKKIEKLLNG